MRERPIGWQHRIICKGAKNQVFCGKFTGLTHCVDHQALVRRFFEENQVKRGFDMGYIGEYAACDRILMGPRYRCTR